MVHWRIEAEFSDQSVKSYVQSISKVSKSIRLCLTLHFHELMEHFAFAEDSHITKCRI